MSGRRAPVQRPVTSEGDFFSLSFLWISDFSRAFKTSCAWFRTYPKLEHLLVMALKNQRYNTGLSHRMHSQLFARGIVTPLRLWEKWTEISLPGQVIVIVNPSRLLRIPTRSSARAWATWSQPQRKKQGEIIYCYSWSLDLLCSFQSDRQSGRSSLSLDCSPSRSRKCPTNR